MPPKLSLPLLASSTDAAKARLVATMEATSDFVGIARPDGSVEFLNRAGRQLVGVADDEDVSQMRATQFYTPETLARISAEGFPTALRRGSWSSDGEVLTLAGVRIPVSIVMVAHPAATRDEPPYFSAVMRDLRERHRADGEIRAAADALSASEKRLRRAIDGGLDAFLVLAGVRDDEGTIIDFDIVDASPRLSELVHTPLEAMIGKRVCTVFPMSRMTGLFDSWVQASLADRAMEWELETRDPRMAAAWLQVQSVPLDRGLAVTLRDISSRKRAEANLRLILDVTRDVAGAHDAETALDIFLSKMCGAAGWELGESWFVTDGTHLTRGPSSYAAADAALGQFVARTARVRFTSGMDLPGAAWATRSSRVLRSLDTAIIVADRRVAAADARLSAGVAVPIIAGGSVMAVVSFLVRDARALDAARLELLDATATQIGAIVGHTIAEHALTRERAFLASVLDSLSESVTVHDPSGRLTLFNRATRRTFGVPAQGALPPERWSEYSTVLLPDGRTPFPVNDLPHVRVLREGGHVDDVELVVAIPNSAPRAMLAQANLVIGPDGTLFGAVCAARDVTAARRAAAELRESEARFRGVLETVRSLAVTLDAQGRITYANPALLALCGRSLEETLGRSWFELVGDSDEMNVSTFGSLVARGEVPVHVESAVISWLGERRLVEWDTTALHDAEGEIVGITSIGRDVTDQRALEARLAEMSEHDELTGLPNRRGFRRMAEHQLRVGSRLERRGALLYIDLDDLKPINDGFGHAAGDEALRAAARVLHRGIRSADLAGRLGGDEFVIFATTVTTAAEARVLAERLYRDLEESNRVAVAAGRPYEVSFTIGEAAVEPGDDLDSALARADAVLNARKVERGAGRSRGLVAR